MLPSFAYIVDPYWVNFNLTNYVMLVSIITFHGLPFCPNPWGSLWHLNYWIMYIMDTMLSLNVTEQSCSHFTLHYGGLTCSISRYFKLFVNLWWDRQVQSPATKTDALTIAPLGLRFNRSARSCKLKQLPWDTKHCTINNSLQYNSVSVVVSYLSYQL